VGIRHSRRFRLLSGNEQVKIKFYIITYNNNEILNDWLLRSISESKYDKNNVEFYVIDNHSNIEIYDEYKDIVKVIQNNLRPDFSTGHLSRNYNQAIINGFEDLNNPKCDVVITCQNDTILCENWYDEVLNHLNNYKYICVGHGDQFQVFTPESIKEIGIFDERFCNIGYHEADFFIRACLYFRDHSSINDVAHNRQLNPIDHQIIVDTPSGSSRDDESHLLSKEYHDITRKLFFIKWRVRTHTWGVNPVFVDIEPLILNHFYYPYFEKNINNLKEKKYLV